MKKRVVFEDSDRHITSEACLRSSSVSEVHKVIPFQFANDNYNAPFTKQWEWEQCCCYHTE